jgi:hypothetical protein
MATRTANEQRKRKNLRPSFAYFVRSHGAGMIGVTANRIDAEVEFPYDEEAIRIIRTIAGRRWHRDDRYWTIPFEQGAARGTAVHRGRFTTTIDGREWTPPAPRTSTSDPFTCLFRILPDTASSVRLQGARSSPSSRCRRRYRAHATTQPSERGTRP